MRNSIFTPLVTAIFTGLIGAAVFAAASVRVSRAQDDPTRPVDPAEQSPGQDNTDSSDKADEAGAGQSDPAAQMAEHELVSGEVIEIVDRAAPGSVQAINATELERFEYNDVHQVLGSVPGVYIRQEDGYGLRPNIGMRGSSSERSAKIALMEDSVLIAPAPYSAPAAYYFPVITRIERVDVLKGPAAIQYGPNTVGGAVNLHSKSIPRQREITLDVAVGQHRYGKLHATYGERRKHVAILIEAVKLRTDGFKELDSGGSTGFDKNDAQIKLRLSSDPARHIYQELELKIGYSDEVSDETYTGLADRDFADTPYRRYAGTQLDQMKWRHVRMQLDHEIDVSGRLKLATTLYRNVFSRDWAKLNGFAGGRSLADILANPDTGANAVLYSVLTGQSESTSDAEALVIGTNARDFVSQGVQLTGRAETSVLASDHAISVGLRYHTDTAERDHTEENYLMTDRELVRADTATAVTRDATGTARALSAYVKDKIRIGLVTVTAGLRGELVETGWQDRTEGSEMDIDGSYSVLIPGLGAVVQVIPELGFLAGVHKGFVPVAPGQDSDIAAEESINYEAGLRYARPGAAAELIGFFSDYSNLKGMCTASRGCASGQIGDEFNGGAVHVLGLEALAAAEIPARRWLQLPVKLSYTFTRSRFDSDFTSANPLWGTVSAGDQMPYVPEHQLSVQAGARGPRWDAAVSARFVSSMRDVAGSGDIALGRRIDGAWVLDLAANYALGRWGTAYLVVDNLLDRATIVSRRPFGARPGKPRTAVLGYKNRF
ncbi:MAG: TonB-dependent receptor [Proteobacteria bacterium]|nr:TonB-dependent receptor [Pseudomonadota bacterium]